MSRYTIEDALKELSDIGVQLLARTENNVSKKKVVEVAKLYALVKLESEKAESEALRLRLNGNLDVEIYSQLVQGYAALGRGIIEIAKSKWLAGDVYALSKAMKPGLSKKWNSLSEYAKSGGI